MSASVPVKKEEKSTAGPRRKSDTFQIMRRLLNYMIGDGNQVRFAAALVVRVASLLGLVATPYLTGQAINVLATPGGSRQALVSYSLWAVIAALSYLGLSALADWQFSKLATQGLYRLQTHLFNQLQTLSLTFFDRQPVGQLMSRVTSDAELVAAFYETAVSQLIRALIQIVLVIGVMLVVNWSLTIAALVVVPVLLVASMVVERVASPAFEKLQEEMGNIAGFQEETITGHKVIISNRRQEWAAHRNEGYADKVFDVASRAYFTTLLQSPITSALIVAQTVIVLFVGSLLVLDGQIVLGTVTAFTAYATLLGTPLSEVANLLSSTMAAAAGGRRVLEIIDQTPTVQDVPGAADFNFQNGRVVFDNVDFSYVKGRRILKHNSFIAEPGQMIGICGPTGAGKSTIINILTRYYDIEGGLVMIDGQDISKLTQASLRRQVGVVLQEAFLFTDTVMNNLKYARPGATDEECIAAAQQANAHEFIMHLPRGYKTVMTERGANLSQGQRQMITIARAMLANPKMLVLDEATSNVDTRTERLIQEGLQRLMAGRTSFVIAHRLSTIRNAHKILVVDDGEIIEAGPHERLMAQRGFYYNLYMNQFKGKAPAGVLKP